VGVLEKQNADIYMLESDLEKFRSGMILQIEINKVLYYHFKNKFNFQESVNSTMFELIIDQEKRIQTLERRHLEVLRAICILQKKHYPWIEKFEQKPIPNYMEEIRKLKPETAPKIMEEVEKVLQQWDETEREK
jgi:exosome complex RNA-binding protein Rrp4